MLNNEMVLLLKDKARFNHKGLISIEDLFDLNLEELDKIYKELKQEQSSFNEKGLLEKDADNIEEQKVNAKLDIVAEIFQIKHDEIEANEKAQERAEKKQKILSIIADKQDENLKAKSIDELKEMLDEL